MKKTSFLMTTLLSLTSILFNVTQIVAQELNQFTIENSESNLNFKSQKQNSISNLPQSYFIINNPEKWTFSEQNYLTSEEDWDEPIHDDQFFWFILVDQLEYRVNDNQNTFNWDIISWVGGDYQKLWIKSEGDVSLDDGNGEAELQVLYGKLIAPYWDLQVGLRYDQLYGDTGKSRGFAVIGLEGLAPYFFEVDTALFLSHQGDVSARFKAEYEFLLSQRLILQPKLETNLAIQKVEEFGVGSGFNDLELGLRLRYEVNRQFAPYIGVSWKRLFGDTAKFAEDEGESSDNVTFVGGFRLMF
jgi:copper resistance protein B